MLRLVCFVDSGGVVLMFLVGWFSVCWLFMDRLWIVVYWWFGSAMLFAVKLPF